MPVTFIPIRPSTFEPGRPYAWLERQQDHEETAMIPVTLIAYDPCPVFLIVRTEAGERRRCLREELYFLSRV